MSNTCGDQSVAELNAQIFTVLFERVKEQEMKIRGEEASYPLLESDVRSFKEIALVMVDQLEYLLNLRAADATGDKSFMSDSSVSVSQRHLNMEGLLRRNKKMEKTQRELQQTQASLRLELAGEK